MPLLSKALSLDNVPLKVPYVLAQTSNSSVFERFRIGSHKLPIAYGLFIMNSSLRE